jgi:hypothetical protein
MEASMQPSPLKRLIVLAAIVTAAPVGVSSAPASAAILSPSADRAFSGKICGLLTAGQLSAAGITDPCVQPKTRGTALVTYIAHWGENGDAHHWLSVTVWRPTINTAFWYASVRGEASGDRAPIKIGSWGYWKTERYNGDRRRGDIMFRVGAYVCMVSLNDDNGAPDEVGIATSLFSIAKRMAMKLA